MEISVLPHPERIIIVRKIRRKVPEKKHP